MTAARVLADFAPRYAALLADAMENRGLAARALMLADGDQRAQRLAEYLEAVALTHALELVIADQSLRARWTS